MRIEKRIPLVVPSLDDVLEQALNRLDLDEYLNAGQVRQAGFAAEATASINIWVHASLEKSPVTETGGFLLGRYRELEDGRFDVGILQFCPATKVAFRSPNRLAFGTEALMELDDALQARPDLQLCGWLHTHPGFSPYLSQMDLAIHEGFFRKPWQLAVVLDPMTAGWDTGVFSWQRNGRMNNKAEYKGQWMSWEVFCRNQIVTSS